MWLSFAWRSGYADAHGGIAPCASTPSRTRIIVRQRSARRVIDDASSLVLDTVTLAAQASTSALMGNSAGDKHPVRSGTRSCGVTQLFSPIEVVIWCFAHHIIIDGIRYGYCSMSYGGGMLDCMLVMKRRCLRRRCNMPIMPSGSANGSGYLAGERTCLRRARLQDAPLLSTFHRCTARHNPLHGSRFSITLDETLSLALKHVAARRKQRRSAMLMLPTGADALPHQHWRLGDRACQYRGAFARKCREHWLLCQQCGYPPILMGLRVGREASSVWGQRKRRRAPATAV